MGRLRWLPSAGNYFKSRSGEGITFTQITGQISAFYSYFNDYGEALFFGPEGGHFNDWTNPDWVGTDVYSFKGISGIKAQEVLPLVGVFLSDELPSEPAPPRLDFTEAHNFETLSPQIGQVFFIGDGLTETDKGKKQIFYVPNTATRLFLGFAESLHLQSRLPGNYQDNVGSLAVSYEVSYPPLDTQSDLDRIKEEARQAGRQECLAPYSLEGGKLFIPCVAVAGPFNSTLLYQTEMDLLPLTEYTFQLVNAVPVVDY